MLREPISRAITEYIADQLIFAGKNVQFQSRPYFNINWGWLEVSPSATVVIYLNMCGRTDTLQFALNDECNILQKTRGCQSQRTTERVELTTTIVFKLIRLPLPGPQPLPPAELMASGISTTVSSSSTIGFCE